MPDDRLCSQCQAWMPRIDDAWCGYCGASCARLELEVKPAVLHLGDHPPRLFFKLTNRTCTGIAVRQIEHPTWLSFPVDQLLDIAPGSSKGILAGAQTANLGTPTSGEVVFASSTGPVAVRVMVIEKSPTLTCTPELVAAWVAPGGQRCSTPVAVAPMAGMLRVRAITLGGITGKVTFDSLGTGVLASAAEGAAAAIEVHAERLSLGLHPAWLDVVFDGPHGQDTARLPIRINVRKPPQLRWAGEHERPSLRHQTERQSLSVVLHNQSSDGREGGSDNADLVIYAISLSPSRGLNIPVLQTTELPVRVAGGTSHTADFLLNLKGLQGQESRLIDFALEVQTNLSVLRGTVSLRVEPMQRFEGVVAIDFGSSNTCCALLPDGGEPELLRLDEDSLVSPTSVGYIDMTQSPPLIETGSLVRGRAAFSEDVAASVADGLKRKLREKSEEIDIRPEFPRKWMSRKASEATADYLRSVRQLAEIKKGATFERFILTHPARCPMRQHERLRRALREAFGASSAPLSYLSEPIAALIPYIARRATWEDKHDYTVASFDLGGGTTDMAVVRIEYRYPAREQVEIVPTVLYCKGTDFGGEDLTAFIRAELEESCKQALELTDERPVIVTAQESGAAALDIRRNRVALSTAAEQFKASLSEQPGMQEPRSLTMRVKQRDGRTVNHTFDFASLSRQQGRELAGTFLRHTKGRVRELAEMLRGAANSRHAELNVIQLSGQTALLPAVREALHEVFGDTAIERADEPKECVVRGACLSQSMRTGRIRLKLLDSMERMTSSIGVFVPGAAYFQPVLRADAPIPPGGLEGRIEGFWSGSEPVVLWEDVDGDDRLIEYASAARHLERLGTWEPERAVVSAHAMPWTLRITVKEFRLTVEALGPNGESVSFRPTNRIGE